jgi:hypothetical protein
MSGGSRGQSINRNRKKNAGDKEKNTDKQRGDSEIQSKKKLHKEKERKGERRSRRARTRVLYFIYVLRVQANKKIKELPALSVQPLVSSFTTPSQ